MTRSDRRTEFEGLYRQHRAAIIRYLIRQGADPDEVEDIAQTAFLHAYRAYAAGTRPEEPRRWLYAVARNTHRRRFRVLAARFRHVVIDPELPAAERDPLLASELAAALAELPGKQRAALVQRELLGLEYEEIARRLDVSVASVQMLLFRARQALRRRRLSLALAAPLQPLARAAETAWSWLQRVGPAEGAAGALAAAVAGAAVVAQAPASPLPAPRPRASAMLLATPPAKPAQTPPIPPTPASTPIPPPPPAPAPAPAAAREPRAVPPPPAPAPPAPAAQRAPEPPKAAAATPASSAPTATAAAPPAPVPPTTTAAAETATSPLQVPVSVPQLDAAAPPEPPASVNVPLSTPPLRAPPVPPPLPVPPAPTVTGVLP